MSFEKFNLPNRGIEEAQFEQICKSDQKVTSEMGEEINTRELDEFKQVLSGESLDVNAFKNELENKTEEEKKSLLVGINNIGFITQEIKSNFFANILKKAGDTTSDSSKSIQEQGVVTRFFQAYSEVYKRQAEKAREQMDAQNSGKLSGVFKQGKNLGLLFGNILRYGRILFDLNYANPLRHIMAASMFLGKTSEAAKEARFKNQKVIEKTRINDCETAANEAWEIYENLKNNSDKEITGKDLELAYNKNISRKILNRLEKKPEGAANNVIQGFASKCILWSAQNLNDKIEKIQNSNISEKEKELKANALLKRKSEMLKDLDRMVSQAGTVDLIAFASRGVEKTGKAVSTAMLIETIYKLPEMLSRISSVIEADDTEIAEIRSNFFSGDDKTKEVIDKANNKPETKLRGEFKSKFGLDIEDLQDANKDSVIDLKDIASIQPEKLNILDIKKDHALSAADFEIIKTKDNALTRMLNQEQIKSLNNCDAKAIIKLSDIVGNEKINKVAQIQENGSLTQNFGTVSHAGITVINPDGSVITDFDANLVHKGDMGFETETGEIIVMKTSGVNVNKEMSLEKVYDQIQTDLDKQGVPKQVQDYFNSNRDQGEWFNKMDKKEARFASSFWKNYGEKILNLDTEKKGEFFKTAKLENAKDVEEKLAQLLNDKILPEEKIIEADKEKVINDIVSGVEKEFDKMEFYTGQENLDQNAYKTVMEKVAATNHDLNSNKDFILNNSREISCMKDELLNAKLDPEEARKKLEQIKINMDSVQNYYGVDVFNNELRDFVNNYKISERIPESNPDYEKNTEQIYTQKVDTRMHAEADSLKNNQNQPFHKESREQIKAQEMEKQKLKNETGTEPLYDLSGENIKSPAAIEKEFAAFGRAKADKSEPIYDANGHKIDIEEEQNTGSKDLKADEIPKKMGEQRKELWAEPSVGESPTSDIGVIRSSVDEFQTGLTGKENLNIKEINRLGLSDWQKQALENQSRVLSAEINKLKGLDPDSPEARSLKKMISTEIKLSESTYGSTNVFSTEIKELINFTEGSDVKQDAQFEKSSVAFSEQVIKENFRENTAVHSAFKKIMGKDLKIPEERREFCFYQMFGNNSAAANYFLNAEQNGKSKTAIENMNNYMKWIFDKKGGKTFLGKNVGLSRTALETIVAQNPFKPDVVYANYLASK